MLTTLRAICYGKSLTGTGILQITIAARNYSRQTLWPGATSPAPRMKKIFNKRLHD
jgi:hypothetical protein